MKKVCTRCTTSKPIDLFHTQNRRGRKGWSSWCKKCAAEYNKTHRKPPRVFSDSEIVFLSEKMCSTCRITKPATDFVRDKHRRSGLSARCRDCANAATRRYYRKDIEKSRARSREYWQKQGGEKTKAASLKTYGLSLEQYDAMLAKQSGKCAICGTIDPGKKKSRLSVDHSHTTGENRELLCHSCNCLIGYAKENPIRLLQAIRYLQKHSTSALPS